VELVVRRSTDVYVVDDPPVAAALRFIAGHSHEGIRVDDVAGHGHVALRTLERRFRAATGRTMTDEIARLRLERAKRLLVESDEPIKSLARDCGFADVKHFHKVFRAAEGTTPGKFRRLRGK
jgi:LacI family transcriptional regulator